MTNDRATELRAEAAEADRKAYESFERSDTDGFLTQWAHGLTAREKRLQAQIEDRGGVWDFPAVVYAATGDEVPTRVINTKFGTRFAFVDGDGKFTGTFLPFEWTERSKHWKLYRRATVTAPAKAVTWAPPGARGLGGATQVQVIAKRIYPKGDDF